MFLYSVLAMAGVLYGASSGDAISASATCSLISRSFLVWFWFSSAADSQTSGHSCAPTIPGRLIGCFSARAKADPLQMQEGKTVVLVFDVDGMPAGKEGRVMKVGAFSGVPQGSEARKPHNDRRERLDEALTMLLSLREFIGRHYA